MPGTMLCREHIPVHSLGSLPIAGCCLACRATAVIWSSAVWQHLIHIGRQRCKACLCVQLYPDQCLHFTLCAGVGKSCLLLRFSEDSFTSSFITTIG
jgi:Ras family